MSAPMSSRDPGSAPSGFEPVPVVDLELSGTPSIPEPNSRGELRVLVRLHGVPLGVLDLGPNRDGAAAPPPVDLHVTAVRQFAPEIAAHLRADGDHDGDHDDLDRLLDALRSAIRPCSLTLTSGRRVSVVLCTLGRDPRLRRAVSSVLDQRHRDLELIVVDNDPASGRVTAALSGLEDPRLRIVTEPRRGLSAARNTGVAASSLSVVAFTDDDAYTDVDWLGHLVAPFDEHPEIACVTGLVLPAELITQAQVWFEEFGAFDKGFARTVWTLQPSGAEVAGRPGTGGVLFPYSAGVYGSGNNMAFRTDWLRGHGGFDEALGAGTPTRGGEDLDAFLRVILHGSIVVYEPRALVRHHARLGAADLRAQMYGYGTGMCAVIAKHVLSSPRGAASVLLRLPAGVRRLIDPDSEKNEDRTGTYPVELSRAELRGYAAGVLLYLRSRRTAGSRSAWSSVGTRPNRRVAGLVPAVTRADQAVMPTATVVRLGPVTIGFELARRPVPVGGSRTP